jgi:hypothetical protein
MNAGMLMDESAASGGLPDMKISVRQVFGIDSAMQARTRTFQTSTRTIYSIAIPPSPFWRASPRIAG